MSALSPDSLADRLERGERVTLLDVRDRDEIDEWRIDAPSVDHVHVPYAKFVAAGVAGDPADLLPDDATEPVVAVCGRGKSSAEVATTLADAGVEAVNLDGGMHGWARVYRRTELRADAGGATVYQYRRPSSGCLAYLVVSDEEALVVDPLRAFAGRYARDAAESGATLTAAVDTHIHADHVSGLRDIATDGAIPYLSETAVERGVTFDAETVADGDALVVGAVTVDVVATPGHTSGMVSLVVGDVLCCGDTLFVDGVPRPDLEVADADATDHARELHRTLTERLAGFADDTVVAPGHYGEGADPADDESYTAPLGDLRAELRPFAATEDKFVERVLRRIPPRPANVETIVAVNLGRERANDETAFELELGPNNCAATAD